MTTRSIEEMATVATYLSIIIPPGHVLTRDGDAVTVRKVLGELFYTKDGALVGYDSRVFHPESVWAKGRNVDDGGYVDVPTRLGADGFVDQSREYHVSECYSTAEAALAAKGKP